jgi:hypothetical protein
MMEFQKQKYAGDPAANDCLPQKAANIKAKKALTPKSDDELGKNNKFRLSISAQLQSSIDGCQPWHEEAVGRWLFRTKKKGENKLRFRL